MNTFAHVVPLLASFGELQQSGEAYIPCVLSVVDSRSSILKVNILHDGLSNDFSLRKIIYYLVNQSVPL